MVKAAELREMSDEQLALTLKDTAEQLFRLRLQAQTERLNAPSELRKQRRLIARVRTIQTQRAHKAAGVAVAANPVVTTPAAAKVAAAKPAAQIKEKK
jgi:large subunit ribosomal protein L29